MNKLLYAASVRVSCNIFAKLETIGRKDMVVIHIGQNLYQSFGDPKARLLIIGLAPAANGGNRTGRMFTGDSSGEWLMKALFETGFANSPHSESVDDGLLSIRRIRYLYSQVYSSNEQTY